MDLIENNKQYLDDFVRLNEEWITTYFVLEDVDKALFADPYKIIDDGGFIFSLVSKGEVLGVCALFNDDAGVYELARMAVSASHQGKGYGDTLMLASLDKLAKIGAKKVYLLSNTKLESAINLYKKHGFTTTFEGQHPVYKRANIVMEKSVS